MAGDNTVIMKDKLSVALSHYFAKGFRQAMRTIQD